MCLFNKTGCIDMYRVNTLVAMKFAHCWQRSSKIIFQIGGFGKQNPPRNKVYYQTKVVT